MGYAEKVRMECILLQSKQSTDRRDQYFYGRFLQDVNFILKNCSTREEFDSELKGELQYYYWCRSEHEALIKPWIGDDSVEKNRYLHAGFVELAAV